MCLIHSFKNYSRCSKNFLNWFSELIENYYIKNKMNEERKIKMNKFVNLLNKKLKNNLDLPNDSNLVLFGSAISGFGSNECDLDICLTNCGIDHSLEVFFLFFKY
jgi:DNA polymerase sigma